MRLEFTVYCKAAPQGSSRAFIIGGKARITAANTKTKPYRQEVAATAMHQLQEMGVDGLMAGKHVPVRMILHFYFAKPVSVAKRRTGMVVAPDLDKLARSTGDSLTGIVYYDDAQVVEIIARKHYGMPERVEIIVETVDA